MTNSPPSSSPKTRPVPNLHPPTITQYRIAVIGEAPGELEDAYGKPFVGPAGKMLGHILERVGLSRDKVFIGNLCRFRPPNNEFSAFAPDSEERIDGLVTLKMDLDIYKPHIVILLGNWPLREAGQTIGVSSFRGTVFMCSNPDSVFHGLKCISTFHPASMLHGSYANLPIVIADFERALAEARVEGVKYPEKTYELDLSAFEIIVRLQDINESGTDCLVSFDIEGGLGRLPCCSISTTPQAAFIIAFDSGNDSRYTLDEEVAIMTELSKMLYNPNIRKCLQNSLYDRFVLAYRYRMLIRNVAEDTMLKHWELFCEFEKGLAFQASYYTQEPYYKSDRKAEGIRDFWTYCCKDSAITHEICLKQDALLQDPQMPFAREHYEFNLALLNVFLFMELRGIRYDSSLAAVKIKDLEGQLFGLQHMLNLAILGDGYLTVDKILDKVCITKRPAIASMADVVEYSRKAYRSVSGRIGSLLESSKMRPLLPAERGELSMLADIHFNCESAAQKKKYLYETRGFPEVRNRSTGEITTNYEALLSISKKTKDPVVTTIIKVTELLTRIQMLSIHSDHDGRIRCGYNVVGTETGRITCYTSPTGSGYNLQTIPQEDRDLYLPDEGNYMFQCDLSGADAWTVAAWCAKMGDSTMLDDLQSGIRIAKVVALMFLKGPAISNTHRDELRILCDEVAKTDPVYFGSKCVQHATNYDAQPTTISATIFTQSEGKINIPTAECRKLQQFYNLRYPGLQRWKNFAANQLLHVGRITAASGHTRVFYGNRRDHHTFKQFLAHEPQANTTYVTHLATLRMWKDDENRGPTGKLVVEPLHQVHDALLGQFPQTRTEWSLGKIQTYFDNTIVVAGREIKIPFEGAYGESWGNLNQGVI